MQLGARCRTTAAPCQLKAVLKGAHVLFGTITEIKIEKPVTLLHVQAFLFVETPSKGPNTAHGLKHGHHLAQRSIPINTTLFVYYSPVNIAIYEIMLSIYHM